MTIWKSQQNINLLKTSYDSSYANLLKTSNDSSYANRPQHEISLSHNKQMQHATWGPFYMD